MADLDKIVFSHSSGQSLSDTINAVSMALPIEARRRFLRIFDVYAAAHDNEGAIARLNGRSVSQIFAEYQPDSAKVVASGELNGLRYELLEPVAEAPESDGLSNPQRNEPS